MISEEEIRKRLEKIRAKHSQVVQDDAFRGPDDLHDKIFLIELFLAQLIGEAQTTNCDCGVCKTLRVMIDNLVSITSTAERPLDN